MNVKEAVPAAAPRYVRDRMPRNNAERVVTEAMHVSPHRDKRMVVVAVAGHPAFIRELLPQDLKVEIKRLTVPEP